MKDFTKKEIDLILDMMHYAYDPDCEGGFFRSVADEYEGGSEAAYDDYRHICTKLIKLQKTAKDE